ncbi:MAG: DUF1501 domain-containing protein [Planctomycetota bacterium]
MANIHSSSDYDYNRRQLLKLAGKGVVLGAAGLSLPNLLFMREAAGLDLDPNVQLFDGFMQIFFTGGPGIGQDIADYKNPADNPTTSFNPINMGVNDVYGNPMRVTDAIQNLAAKAQNDPMVSLAVVRSMRHNNNNHGTGQEMNTSWWQGALLNTMPAIAPTMAYYMQGKGVGIPAVLVNGDNGNNANNARGNTRIPTALTVTVGGNQNNNPVVEALSLPQGVDQARYSRRKAMLDQMNARFLSANPDGLAKAYEKATKDAFDITMKGEAAAAFDLAGKPLLPGGNNGIRQRATLAQNLLLAGVPYVSMGQGGNDYHGNANQSVTNNWQNNLDVYLPAMIDNLKASGKRYLIQICGDFDRTPDGKGGFGANDNGRDHWGEAQSHILIGVNQPKLKTTAVGDTGPRGTGTVNTTRRNGQPGVLVDPFPMAAMGYVVYRGMGINLFQPDGYYDIPTTLRDAPPVDRQIGLTDGVKLSNFLIA